MWHFASKPLESLSLFLLCKTPSPILDRKKCTVSLWEPPNLPHCTYFTHIRGVHVFSLSLSLSISCSLSLSLSFTLSLSISLPCLSLSVLYLFASHVRLKWSMLQFKHRSCAHSKITQSSGVAVARPLMICHMRFWRTRHCTAGLACNKTWVMEVFEAEHCKEWFWLCLWKGFTIFICVIELQSWSHVLSFCTVKVEGCKTLVARKPE